MKDYEFVRPDTFELRCRLVITSSQSHNTVSPPRRAVQVTLTLPYNYLTVVTFTHGDPVGHHGAHVGPQGSPCVP